MSDIYLIYNFHLVDIHKWSLVDRNDFVVGHGALHSFFEALESVTEVGGLYENL